MWDRKELKRKGLAAFKANYWKCVLIGVLLTMFVAGTAASTGRTARSGMNETSDSGSNGTGDVLVITSENSGGTQTVITEAEIREAMQDPRVRNGMRELLAVIGAVLLVICLISACLRLLVFNPLEAGCCGFFTRNTETPASLDEVKAGFQPYGRTVRAMFLRDLFLCLWYALFLIPGLIKRYSYRMVPYILADDPTIGARDAIDLSRKMMNGHKWNTFVLDLSFIGWDLLAVVTLGLLGVFYVNPYQFSTGAELYQTLKFSNQISQ